MSDAMMLYAQKKLYKIAMVLLVVGGLNWGLIGAFRFNLVERFFGKALLARGIYFLVGVCALTVMFSRDFYLPFLGQSIVPCGAIKEKVPEGATIMLPIRISPGQKVLYWATEPATEKLKEIRTWDQAYLGFENAGVTIADDKGLAVLKVRKPQAYTVPVMGRLEPHIHYRLCQGNGMLGRVETAFLDQKAVNTKENFLYRYG